MVYSVERPTLETVFYKGHVEQVLVSDILLFPSTLQVENKEAKEGIVASGST
jgi:hypothetical protein